MALLTEVLGVARTTRNAFNYWMREGVLRTEFEETTPGVARELSQDNALEIALVAALTRAGLDPAIAGQSAASIMAEYAGRKIKRPFYILNPYTGFGYLFGSLDTEMRTLLSPLRENSPGAGWSSDHEGEGVTQFAVVNCGEIVRRVDALFQAETR
jgi:hypothetical protein